MKGEEQWGRNKEQMDDALETRARFRGNGPKNMKAQHATRGRVDA